ncbi:hypothetical protein MycrhDRAFT_5529 [Mycolicibacterium rhodesiae JS60]|nr:hypothetical protein MycrhDRAFT_5529 [Mycolicibacterium rhodesiae JS60]
MKMFRRKTPAEPVSFDTRRVNLTQLGQSRDTLSSRIDWPDLLRPLDAVFATKPVDEDPVVAETSGLIESAAPLVDEFTADALNGWLEEHLPGWHAHTDYEAQRRMDVQRTLIAEITQNYAMVAARIHHQRDAVAQLDAVVHAADHVLAGLADSPADPAASRPPVAQAAVRPLALPDRTAFGHPDLSDPTLPARAATSGRGQHFSVVGENAASDVPNDAETEGEVA